MENLPKPNMNPQPKEMPAMKERQMSLPGSYVAAVIEIIRQVRRLSLLAPTTTSELTKLGETWARMLFGLIPEHELENTFVQAYRNHTPGWPMECAAMMDAWKRIRALRPPSVTYTKNCTMCEAHRNNPSLPPCQFHPKCDFGFLGKVCNLPKGHPGEHCFVKKRLGLVQEVGELDDPIIVVPKGEKK